MLTQIIEFSVRNKLIIGLLTLGLIGYGIYQATRLPIDAVPDITNNQVQVITVAPSFGATDIERLVTFPIEQANSNIPGLKEMRSFSRFGLSLVTIVFDDATDVYWARQQVAERLQQVQTQIPPGIGTPVLGPVSTGLGEIYQYVVKPKKGYEQRINATELRTIQDWLVRRQLLGVKGVAEVSSFGGNLKQYEVAVDPNKLNAYGITITDVFEALEKNNQNTGGAYIEKGPSVLFIRSEGLIGNEEDIRNITITGKHITVPLFLRDVADVRIGKATRFGALCYNDEGEVSGAVVMMLKGANSSEVIKNVKERIAQIEKTLPEGVEIVPFLDRTKMVNHAIGTVEKNLLEGALIVLLVLVLFLGNVRAGLLVASVIPLSMLFAICMMNAFGVSGNLMSLGALDFGLIVDGAVIIVEAVMHQLHHNARYSKLTLLNTTQMNDTVTSSAGRMMNSAVFGQIIILIVYLPIFTLEGIEGKMFKPMAQTVSFALAGAFILSLTYVPMMSALFLSKKVNHTPSLSDRIMHKLEHIYSAALARVIRFPRLVLASVIGLFALSAGVLTTLGGEFIPALEEGDFAVDTRVLTGSNLQTTIQSTQQAAHLLKSRFPEVLSVVTKIGSGEVPTDPMPMEASDMIVTLKDKKDWTSAHSFDELSAKMSEVLEEVPGITAGFQFPVQMRFNELMTGARQDVVCKIFGENMDTLAATAAKLAHVAGQVKGAENIYVEPVTGVPQIIITYNRPLLARYHLSIADINKVVNTAFAGQSTGTVFEEEKRFDLVVRLSAQARQQPEDVQQLLIPTPQGIQVPLSQLASVEVTEGPNQIQRENAQRRIVVGFNVKGRDVQSIVDELRQKTDASIKLPAGYHITYGGAFENLLEARKRLSVAVPVSLILIFVLLYFAFHSVRHGLLIYSAIPLSAIGGILLLAARGLPFSISAGVGFIALFGVSVLNGIVLIAAFNRLKQQGITQLSRIVLRGTRLRLRPVLMTAFVASLGFLPMAVSNGAGAEVQRPLATVVIGGLLVATFLTLFVLPVLYIAFEKGIKPNKRKATVAAVILCLVMSNGLFAQQPIDLAAALQKAVQSNSNIKSEKAIADYRKALIAAATELPKTNISLEYGQINSAYNDSRLNLSQSMAFPTVYSRQKAVYNNEWKQSVLQVGVRIYEIQKAVTKSFYHYLYLKEKEKLLQKADTLYTRFAEKAALRLQKGESNVLEKTTAEMQQSGIRQQLIALRSQLSVELMEFRLLLNTDSLFVPYAASAKASIAATDSAALQRHPALQLLQQEQQSAAAQTALEQSRLLPDLSLGYNNNSFIGAGADGKNYSGSQRFNSVQAGVAVPIFASGQKARIKASRQQEKAVASQYEARKQQLLTHHNMLKALVTANQQLVADYEQIALNHARIVYQTATKQFVNGEINYLDYVLLLNQAIAIESNYTDALKALNDSIIDFTYPTTE